LDAPQKIYSNKHGFLGSYNYIVKSRAVKGLQKSGNAYFNADIFSVSPDSHYIKDRHYILGMLCYWLLLKAAL